MADPTPAYEDRFCKITKTHVCIKWHYFPTTQTRRVVIGKIKTVYHDKQGWDWTNSKSWGMALTPIWWACDMSRKLRGAESKIQNVVLDVGENTDKGFSVEDVDAFLNVLMPMLNPGVSVLNKMPY